MKRKEEKQLYIYIYIYIYIYTNIYYIHTRTVVDVVFGLLALPVVLALTRYFEEHHQIIKQEELEEMVDGGISEKEGGATFCESLPIAAVEIAGHPA